MNHTMDECLNKLKQLRARLKECEETFGYLYNMNPEQKAKYAAEFQDIVTLNVFTIGWSAAYKIVMDEKHRLQDLISEVEESFSDVEAVLFPKEEEDDGSED